MVALVLQWQQHAGLDVPVDPGIESYMQEIDERYGYLIEKLFDHEAE
jgi:hypothetical protein